MKEWACAGAFFELTGAFVSHIAHGSAVVHHFYPGSFAARVGAAWALRPASGKPSVPVFRRYGQVTWVEETRQRRRDVEAGHGERLWLGPTHRWHKVIHPVSDGLGV
ncbi:hypothetical protein [Nocardia sp. NPDC047648]|uniref:hypothetical protein n=1 Tax=Nocardia sp. NPDC047648 TaxID=3155625 RepID=UPI0033CEA899